jgi:hypothetical protein
VPVRVLVLAPMVYRLAKRTISKFRYRRSVPQKPKDMRRIRKNWPLSPIEIFKRTNRHSEIFRKRSAALIFAGRNCDQ